MVLVRKIVGGKHSLTDGDERGWVWPEIDDPPRRLEERAESDALVDFVIRPERDVV